MTNILVADIGGSKIDFAVLSAEQQGYDPLVQGQVASGQFASCSSALAACLSQANLAVDFACLGLAGPINGEQVNLTNLPWRVDRQQILAEFGWDDLLLVNDLQATCAGVAGLSSADLMSIKAGKVDEHGLRLVIAPGTGLGASWAVWSAAEHSYQSMASESGHFSFSPGNELEIRLLEFLQQNNDHVSFEMVCSGLGMANLLAFCQGQGMVAPSWLSQELAAAAAGDVGQLLSQAMIRYDQPEAIAACCYEIFYDILAEFCGNLAVNLLPYGGIYLAGGIVPKTHSYCDFNRFNQRFSQRGKMSQLVAALPISLISHSHPALVGGFLVAQANYNQKC